MREHQHVSVFWMTAYRRGVEIRIQHNRNQSDQNPRPWPDRVVRDVEPQNGEQSLAFVLRAEDALRDVASAARLSAGIPECPPLHSEVDQQSDNRKSPPGLASESVGKIRKELQRIAMGNTCRGRLGDFQLIEQCMH